MKAIRIGFGLAFVFGLGVKAHAEPDSKLAAARTVPFSLAAPAGPQFTDAQKQAQREAGHSVLPQVLEAFSNGVESVRIPPGDYRSARSAGAATAAGRAGVQRPAARRSAPVHQVLN